MTKGGRQRYYPNKLEFSNPRIKDNTKLSVSDMHVVGIFSFNFIFHLQTEVEEACELTESSAAVIMSIS